MLTIRRFINIMTAPLNICDFYSLVYVMACVERVCGLRKLVFFSPTNTKLVDLENSIQMRSTLAINNLAFFLV